jgi:hypothetical protein
MSASSTTRARLLVGLAVSSLAAVAGVVIAIPSSGQPNRRDVPRLTATKDQPELLARLMDPKLRPVTITGTESRRIGLAQLELTITVAGKTAQREAVLWPGQTLPSVRFPAPPRGTLPTPVLEWGGVTVCRSYTLMYGILHLPNASAYVELPRRRLEMSKQPLGGRRRPAVLVYGFAPGRPKQIEVRDRNGRRLISERTEPILGNVPCVGT